MSNAVYINHKKFYLLADSELVRRSDIYDEIKLEINKNSSMLSGGTDWEKVRSQCTLLAEKVGIDLVTSCYYAVAAVKSQGLTGLANGLEVIASSLMNVPDDVKSLNKRKELVEWFNASVIKEIKLFSPSYEKLRDLYRCEQFCEKIDKAFLDQSPQVVGMMDNLAYVIFEHIDRLEMQYRKNNHFIDNHVVQEKSSKLKTSLVTALVTLLLCCLFAYAYWLTHLQFNPKDYVYSAASDERSLSPNEREAVKGYISTLEAPSLNVFGHRRFEQDINLQALEAKFPNDETIASFRRQWVDERLLALDSVNKMTHKFESARNQLANVNLKVQKTNLKSIKNEIESVTKIAKSLSPVYARVDYIEQLILKGEYKMAREELDILTQRLAALDWKQYQLQQRLRFPVNQVKPEDDLHLTE